MKRPVIHLNGWQRISVIVSILSFMGCFVHIWKSTADSANNFAAADAGFCERFHPFSDDYCYQQARPLFFKMSWRFAGEDALLSAAPIALAWLIAWVIYLVFKWVRAEFAKQSID